MTNEAAPATGEDATTCCAGAAAARLRADIDRAKQTRDELADVVRAHPATSIAVAAAIGAALAYVLARRR